MCVFGRMIYLVRGRVSGFNAPAAFVVVQESDLAAGMHDL